MVSPRQAEQGPHGRLVLVLPWGFAHVCITSIRPSIGGLLALCARSLGKWRYQSEPEMWESRGVDQMRTWICLPGIYDLARPLRHGLVAFSSGTKWRAWWKGSGI